MTVDELIERLAPWRGLSIPVMVLDGANGGGCLRDINLGPTYRMIGERDARDTADCEGRQGEDVVTIGFGYY